MSNACQNRELEQQERRIDFKQALLAYLRGNPKKMTIESYLCLAGLLSKAGWRNEAGQWHKSGITLPPHEAAELELEQQIQADKDHLLRQTIPGYRTESKYHA